MEELSHRIDRSYGLLKRMDKLQNITGSGRLRRRFVAELRFLEELKTKEKQVIDRHLHSSNLPFLETVLRITEEVKYTENIFALYCYVDENGVEKQVTVDIITKEQTHWIKVVARNPQALYRTWLGQGQYGSKCICDIAKEFIDAKEHIVGSEINTKVVFHFENGIMRIMRDNLVEIGVTVTGVILSEEGKVSLPIRSVITSGEFSSFGNHSVKVNLDITALVAMVSSLTNGGSHKFKDKILNDQAEEEKTEPALPRILNFVKGKELFVCRTAYNDFCSILETVGGREEKKRAEKLLSSVTLIDDQPSLKSQSLVESGKVRARPKIIFGTGDTIQAVTLTANSSFVRAANNQGVKFQVYLHGSRALTEQKESELVTYNE